MSRLSRTLLFVVVPLLLAGFGPVLAQNPIVTENALPGNPTSEWDISGAGDANIQGFATDISINLGGTIDFKIKTDATSYYLDIYRLGYYQGNGARKIAGPILPTATLPQVQPACLTDAPTGLLDCGNWGVSATWTVPAGTTSGIFIAKLNRDDGTAGQSHIAFVVRDDDGGSDILFQTSDTTWQAYNRYGEAGLFDGYSLYQGPTGHANKVSYNRPFTTRGVPSEDWLFNAEYPMVRWLERNGYDVSYFTDIDSDRYGAELLEHQIFMSVGHDEYWSAAQRTNVEAARDAGVHLAFFSGNEVYWKVRWEDSIDASETPYRTLVCYKEGTLGELASGGKTDPLPDVWTGLWRDGCPWSPPADGCQPENELTGQISWVGTTGPITVPYAYSNHRIWRNTAIANLQPGETATLPPGLLGYEWNPYQQAYAAYYPSNIEWLSQTNYSGQTHYMSLYEAPSGALVFGAGTVQWSWGLDFNHDRSGGAEDVRVQQATVNLMGDMGIQPETLQANLVPGLPCVSDCTGRVCGDDGCGDSCGECEVGVTACTELGQCEPCDVDRCLGRECGDDGCGSTCGSCQGADTCEEVTGQCEPLPCPCSLWDDTVVPAVDSSDSTAVELGIRFQPLVDGYITGVRFYKAVGNTGAHVGSLWTDAGVMLETVTFTGETASGWQEAPFPSPVAVTAGQNYVASYHTTSGYYSYDEYYFLTQGYEDYPLAAHADGLQLGSNGVYVYSAGTAFPTETWHSANYWVDPVFNVTAEDLQPPLIITRTPSSGATGVTTGTTVTATFNEAIVEATLTFELSDPNNPVSATVTYDAPSRTATLTPDAELAITTTYTASVSGVEDSTGNVMPAPDTWSFTTGSPPGPPPDEGPGGPILVIADVGNPFGRYFAEILRTEGLNYFAVTDISLVTPAILGQHEVVILGEMALTAGDVTMLSDWVTSGGKLIAMRPDKQLAGLLGLTDDLATLANAYLLVDTLSSPGQGIVGDTIQYHGIADLYSLNGAIALATLYSDASNPTPNPAVTLNAVGAGYAAAFTYDLARSVVYTRQGNPPWAGQERDGIAPIRSDDMFYGDAAGDPQTDWIDLNKVDIPQADEQQRLLANLIYDLNDYPLPRFWYFPSGHKAVVIMTGDHHGCCDNTFTRFDTYLSQSPAGCVLEDWECVRASSYVYPNSQDADAQAAAYDSQGFEIGLHVDTNCANWTPSLLESQYTGQMASFTAQFPSLPNPDSERNHCITWSDWVTQPQTMLNHGIRLDTNYYFWPPDWVLDRPGMFTGSGMVMRFAELDGTMVDVYQATTQMTDESGQSYPFNADSLLDAAIGPLGYYGAFTTNMHMDQASHAASNAIVGSALARGVPVVSGRQMLEWLDGRNASVFSSINWNGNVLAFDVTVGTGARNLRGMVPTTSSAGALTELTRDTAPIGHATETVKGIEYAVFDAQAGSYAASYDVDTTPPLISNVAAASEADGTALITWDTHEAASSLVTYGTDPGSLTLSVALGALVTAHAVDLAGLDPITTYYYRVTSSDAFGNSATDPTPPAAPLNFTTPAAICFLDTIVADFSGGTLDANGYIAEGGDGEIMLVPTEGSEFSGTTLPAGWTAAPWSTGGDAVVGGGIVTVDTALLSTDTFYGPGRVLEFDATFTGDVNQHVGLGTDLNGPPWAIISTKLGGPLYARTNTGTETETLLSGASFGPHRFRIEWNATSVDYYVDDALAASHSVAIAGNLRPVASDAAGGGAVAIDWIHMSPFGSPSTFVSRVFGDGSIRAWGTATWAAGQPAGTALSAWVRSGDTPTPDGTWTGFVQVPASGAELGGDSAYLQYSVVLESPGASRTPFLEEMYVGCGGGLDLTPPTIISRSPAAGATEIASDESVLVTFSERMDAATLTTATFRLRASGDVTDVPATVTSDGYTAVLDPVSPLDIARTYTVTVDATVADTAGNTLETDDTWFFSTLADVCVIDETLADFNAGTTILDTYIAETSDGEVILQPDVATEFSGTALPSGWQSSLWDAGGYADISGGVITMEASRFWTDAAFGPTRTLEFTATFGAGLYQHVGFVSDPDFTGPWGMFSTNNTSTTLYARVNGSGVENIDIPGSWLGSPHRYRIDWTASGNFVFWIDGIQKVTSTQTVSQNLKFVASDRPAPDGVEMSVDWIRLSPYPLSGTFDSRVLDYGLFTAWHTLTATADLPPGTTVSFETRTGNTPTPDGSWSAFAPASGGTISSPSGRYLQYQAVLTTPDDDSTPTIEDVTACGTACVATSVPESVCNGLDDDCDGAADEDYIPVPTTCGVGECGAAGVIACVGGVLQPDTCTPGSPTAEVCDGLDNNCDTNIDENGALLCDDLNVCSTDVCAGAPGCAYSVSGVCQITGTAKYYRNGSAGEPGSNPVPDVDIDLSGDVPGSATTDASGYYSLGALLGTFTVKTMDKYGTPRASDHNGAVTTYDATRIAQHAVGTITLSDNQQLAGDVTNDSNVTSMDAAQVARFAVQLDDHFPVANDTGSDWNFLRCDDYTSESVNDCAPIDPDLHPDYDHTPLTQAESDDFYAILYGDVTGNWLNGGGGGGGATMQAEATAALLDRTIAAELSGRRGSAGPPLARAVPARLSLDGWPTSRVQGARTQVVLSVDNVDGILAMDLTLDYNSARISIIDVQTTLLTTGFNLATNDRDGRLKLALYGVEPLEGSGDLLIITVETKGQFPRGLPFTLEGQINEGLIPIDIQTDLKRPSAPAGRRGRQRR